MAFVFDEKGHFDRLSAHAAVPHGSGKRRQCGVPKASGDFGLIVYRKQWEAMFSVRTVQDRFECVGQWQWIKVIDPFVGLPARMERRRQDHITTFSSNIDPFA